MLLTEVFEAGSDTVFQTLRLIDENLKNDCVLRAFWQS